MLLYNRTGNINKNGQCISVTVPILESQTSAHINCSEYDNTCPVITPDSNTCLATHMIHLVATIIRKDAPHITHIVVDDMSKLKCELPPGSDVSHLILPLSHFYVAFYGKTWYEHTFGAVMCDHDMQEEYMRLINRRDDPAWKPEYYSFPRNEIYDMLCELYKSTLTWREFFDKIANQYGIYKNAVIFPWIICAITGMMSGSRLYNCGEWEFEIGGLPMVEYRAYKMTPRMSGGAARTGHQQRSRTRKRKMHRETNMLDVNAHARINYSTLIR